MAPHRAQPFDVFAIMRIAGYSLEAVEYIAAPHLAQAEQQLPGVIEHHARIASGVNQLRNDVAHTGIAFREHGRVVIVADVGMPHHVIEIADESGRA